MIKKCSVCGKEKEIDDFPINKKNKSGYDSRCKECRNEYLKRQCCQNEKIIMEKK